MKPDPRLREIIKKSFRKITCLECQRKCCDDLDVTTDEGEKIPEIENLPKGTWLYTRGITLVKKRNGLWRCRAFDRKTRLCRIWEYRPPICRDFFCSYSKPKKRKEIFNSESEEKYVLTFQSSYKEISGKGGEE